MPHTARRYSESGYYHVVVKGIADQIIFEDDVDREYYVQLLDEAKSMGKVTLHAYCLMSNHVHLVLETPDDTPAMFMKFVHERYGAYYANKIGRGGGIFRKPYWSEPIETDEYLLCAVRYVHANPAVAGICAASAYKWSSARDYLGRKGVSDTFLVLDMCDGRDGFIRFSREAPMPGLPFPGSNLYGHMNDDEALRVAKCEIGEETLADIAGRAPAQRQKLIKGLRYAGLSGKQIIRITGLGKTVVYNALKEKD